MGRPSTGWKIRLPRGSSVYAVRFTHASKRIDRTTGERDRERASREAAQIYSETLAGREGRAARSGVSPFSKVSAEWLAATEAQRDEQTNERYAEQIAAHLEPWFKSLEYVTRDRAEAYMQARLKHVTASTVRKELSVLRQIVTWRLGDRAPKILGVPKRAIGTDHKQGRRGPAPELSREEVFKVMRQLPRGKLRRYYLVLWETGLRPATVQSLQTPGNFVPGRRRLWIGKAQDKARAARWVPLTPLAELMLRLGTDGSGDHRVALRSAGQRAGLDASKVEVLTQYHLRGARITYWLEHTHNVAGVMHLVGHVRLETTSRYLRPSERAAQQVLRFRGR